MKQPNSFFKFVTRERTDILANGMIRFTPPDQFNDPFELRPCVTHLSRCWMEYLQKTQHAEIAFENEDYRFSSDRYNRIHLYKEKLNNQSKEVGILSLSASCDTSDNPSLFLGNPDDPRRNLLMWAHYGASHTGFVIEFRHDFLEEQAQEVLYSMDRQFATFEDIDEEVNVSYLCKSRDWEYENEWRHFKKLKNADKILGSENHPIHLFRFKKSAVKSVTFGCKASEETKDEVMQILEANPEYRGASIFFAHIDDQGFDLTFHQEFLQDGSHWSNEFAPHPFAAQKRIGTY